MVVDRKAVKRERRELYRMIGDICSEHIPLDKEHKMGQDPSCDLCERYNLFHQILKEKEHLLKSSNIQEEKSDS